MKFRELRNLKFRELGNFGTWELWNLVLGVPWGDLWWIRAMSSHVQANRPRPYLWILSSPLHPNQADFTLKSDWVHSQIRLSPLSNQTIFQTTGQNNSYCIHFQLKLCSPSKQITCLKSVWLWSQIDLSLVSNRSGVGLKSIWVWSQIKLKLSNHFTSTP